MITICIMDIILCIVDAIFCVHAFCAMDNKFYAIGFALGCTLSLYAVHRLVAVPVKDCCVTGVVPKGLYAKIFTLMIAGFALAMIFAAIGLPR